MYIYELEDLKAGYLEKLYASTTKKDIEFYEKQIERVDEEIEREERAISGYQL